MSAYQNTLPPISLFSGDVGFSFNNEAFPGGAASESQFAIPSFTGLPDGGTAVPLANRLRHGANGGEHGAAGAINDVDAEYQTLDTTIVTWAKRVLLPTSWQSSCAFDLSLRPAVQG